MSTLEEKLVRLREFNASVRGTDARLAEELADVRGAGLEGLDVAPRSAEEAVELESIAMRTLRPVLAIKDNETQLEFVDEADSKVWKQRLQDAKPFLADAIRAVGRIDLQGSRLDWVGTGWLVHDNILVTNRHVANEFAMRKGQGLNFRMGSDGPIGASVDFLQEIANPRTLVFKLVRPLHIEEEPGPDVSFFEVEQSGGDGTLAKPIVLAGQVTATENAATIGYPAYDSRIPEPDLMEKIFGKTYSKKRLAPGGVTRVEATRLLHNCTTLGGNSGSVVVDLDSGQALGLHFSGSFLTTNYAVRADVVRKLLDNVRSGRAGVRRPAASTPATRPGIERLQSSGAVDALGRATMTIPLTVTISLGVPTPRSPAPLAAYRPSAPLQPQDGGDGDGDAGDEAVAEDYLDRAGYQRDFLGRKFTVDLPEVVRHADDVLDFAFNGAQETELRYEHYSVVMSRSRRMCFLSAVNIDGNLSKKSKRVGWKWDPRVPKAQQIMNECYGNPPRFSRGHMTRREDPGWGNAATAKRGNEDSMHVTNVTPQMQAFNSPIWLALEDYALEHAREDDMKISVFTGPYFTDDDPTMYGVRIPLAFWKIIAFIHDETGRLCATGYEMNQEQSLQPQEEFVFGAFTSPQLGVATQVPIRSIEAKSGISFGKLAAVDPLSAEDESIDAGGIRSPLAALEHIRFLS
jgi:endonuclease G